MTSASETNGEYRITGGLLVLLGGTFTYWAWDAARNGVYEMLPSVLGPTLLSLGVGLLIHGTGIAIGGVNALTRVYGLAGVALTVAMLAVYGFFARPVEHAALWWAHSALPFALGVYWLLPAKRLGGTPHDPLAGVLAAAEKEKASRARPVHGSGASASSGDAPSRKPATSSTATRRDKL